MRIGKAKSRFDVVIREWQKSKIIKQRVISPIYETTVEELKDKINKFLNK